MEFTRILNCTPHTINICDASGNKIQDYPTYRVARVETEMEVVGNGNGIPIKRVKYKEAEWLPQKTENTLYIVSMVVAQACPEREDFICPNTAPNEVVRDDEGKIIGVKSFAKY